MEDYKEEYELGSIVTAKRTYNGEIITGEFGGFHLLDKSNPKSIVGVVHTPKGSYDVEHNSIESVISEDEKIKKILINIVKGACDDFGIKYKGIEITEEKLLAWLEKQGEQSHCNGEVNDEALQQQLQIWFNKGKCSGRDEVIFHPENFGLQKQGEQKPAEYTLKDAVDIFLDALSKTPYNNKPITDAQVITRELLKFLSDARSYNPNALNEQKYEELPNGEDYGIDGLYHAARILEKTLGEVEGYESDDGILEHKCAIEAVKRLYKQKPAWSEEDEHCIELLLPIIDSSSLIPKNRKKCKKFLKSLKERMKGE